MADLDALPALARRSARQTLSRPQFLAPVLLLPTIFLVAYSGGAASLRHLPGFPAGYGMFDYQIGGDMLLSAVMAGVIGGIAQIVDIQVRFIDRLLLSPVPRGQLLLGRLAGIGLLGLLGGVVFSVIAFVFGARPARVTDLLILFLLQALTAVAWGSITTGVALRTGKPSTVQTLLPLSIVLVMFSSAFVPRRLLDDPLDTIARFNPLTYVSDALHEPWIGGVTTATTVKALVALAVLGLIGAGLCAGSLRHRVEG
ncbi:ABC transporter permease [Micromonospora sp. NPDC049044]|uniref:ABC transporter permease n=1 Tax=unclassified Micromonospora TaxID=2617518 RepID=UPI0033F3DD8D